MQPSPEDLESELSRLVHNHGEAGRQEYLRAIEREKRAGREGGT